MPTCEGQSSAWPSPGPAPAASAPGRPASVRPTSVWPTSVWDTLQLGWLDEEVVLAARQKALEPGPHEDNSAKAQGVVVVLPKTQVTATLPTPP